MAKTKGRIEVSDELCKGCGLCVAVCPNGNLRLEERSDANGGRVAVFMDQENCTGCRFCAFTCPDVAIEVYRLEQEEKQEASLHQQ